MAGKSESRNPEIGVCGLSCRLCPRFYTDGSSRCYGCKSAFRMSAGCPFITCAVKKRGLEFCWDCAEGETCEKWRKHREAGKQHDSFISYQRLDDNINYVAEHGLAAFVESQKRKEELLRRMLTDFDEGRSKSYYCVAAAVLTEEELSEALAEAGPASSGQDLKDKAKTLHRVLDDIAARRGYTLKLRK